MKKIFTFMAAAAICCACADEVEYDACGTFEATEVVVSSQGAGQIINLSIEEGDDVEAGVQIGIIDTVQLHLQKVQLEAQMRSVLSSRPDVESQVSAVRSQIAKQKSEKVRVEKLIARGAAPAKQLDDINAQIEVLEDQLAAQLSALSKSSSSIGYNALALQSQIAQLEDRIAKCRIVSPVSGTVIAKYVNEGELAPTPLALAVDTVTRHARHVLVAADNQQDCILLPDIFSHVLHLPVMHLGKNLLPRILPRNLRHQIHKFPDYWDPRS